MLIRCIDFETTGIPNDDDPHARPFADEVGPSRG